MHFLKCLDAWRGLKRTKQQNRKENIHYSVSISLDLFISAVCWKEIFHLIWAAKSVLTGEAELICQRFTQRASETWSMLSSVIDKNSYISVRFWRVCLGIIPRCRELSRWDKSQPVYFTWNNIFLHHFFSCFPVKTSLKQRYLHDKLSYCLCRLAFREFIS